jgi:hypothetical protein
MCIIGLDVNPNMETRNLPEDSGKFLGDPTLEQATYSWPW